MKSLPESVINVGNEVGVAVMSFALYVQTRSLHVLAIVKSLKEIVFYP